MRKQTKITKSARNELCQIRIPGICNFNKETTVLCHLNGFGMGIKAIDIHGAYGCSACHDEVDRRTKKINIEDARKYFHDAIIRTQLILVEKGLVKINA